MDKSQIRYTENSILSPVIISLVILAALLIGCDDIFEEDLTNQSVVLLNPVEQASLKNTNVNFLWEQMEGANAYNIQLVKGSFAMPEAYLLDSTVTDNRYEIDLLVGKYEWKVAALNASSISKYIQRTFTIDTSGISDQTVTVYTPEDSSYQNTLHIQCSWQPLTDALFYEIQLDLLGTDTVTLTKQQLIATETQLSTTYEGWHTFKVFGLSENLNPSIPTTHKILVDTTTPKNSVITSILTDTITDETLLIEWDQYSDVGSPIYDSIFLYSDSALITAQKTNFDFYRTPALPKGNLKFKIATYDVAGNRSANEDSLVFVKS